MCKTSMLSNGLRLLDPTLKQHHGAYFNDLSAWYKAHSASALRACPNLLLLV